MLSWLRHRIVSGYHAGMTLPKLLLWLAAGGVVAWFVWPHLDTKGLQRRRGWAAQRKMLEISEAIENYRQDKGVFPGNLSVLTTGDTPYLNGIIPLDPWGKPYVYRRSGGRESTSYVLMSYGEDGREGTSDDIVN